MRIYSASKLIIVVVLLLSCTSIGTMLYSYHTLEQSRQITNSLVGAVRAANELLAGSDYLTTCIRAYAVTGDRRHHQAFKQEQFVTRSRDLALAKLERVGLTREEIGLLEAAKRNSDALIRLEDQAASAVAAGDLAKATSLTFGVEYQQAKASVVGPIYLARDLIETRIFKEQQESVQLAKKVRDTAVSANVFSALVVLSALLMFFQRRVVNPINTLTRQVGLLVRERRLTRFDYQEESSEVGELARALNDYSHKTEVVQQQQRFKTFFDLSNEAVFIQELPSCAIVDVNQTMCEMYGYAYEEVMHLTVEDLSSGIPPYTHSQVLEWVGKTRSLGPQIFEWHAKRKSGCLFWVEVRMSLVTIDNDERIIVTVRDITERKHIEDALLSSQAQLNALASELSLAQERERRRIALEIHDHLVQNLTLGKLMVSNSIRTVSTDKLAQVSGILDEAIRQMRSLIFQLSPHLLYEMGLVPALEALGERLGKEHGFSFNLLDCSTCPPLEEDILVGVFQSVRELFMNIVKHAQASNVTLHLESDGASLRIALEDDGVGFEVENVCGKALQQRSIGLFGVQQRLRHLGGSFEIESSTGRGARLELAVPVTSSAPARRESPHEHTRTAC